MFVTYLVCLSETRYGMSEGLFGFNVFWDRAKRPSECLWYVPGTDKQDPDYRGEFFWRAPGTGV